MWLTTLFSSRTRIPGGGRAGRTRPANNHRKPGDRTRSFVPRLEILEDRMLPSSLTVMNTNDKGPGSLRGTITNAKSGDTIVFAPSLEGHRTVQPTPVKHPVRESLPAVLAFRSSLSLSKNTVTVATSKGTIVAYSAESRRAT